jgi:hypothetical protein
MAGEVVPLKAEQKPSADAKAETALKTAMLHWAEDIAGKVIKAVSEDITLHFLDNVDDEESSLFDLQDDYDPIVDQKTGARLSDAIAEFAEEIKQPGQVLRRIYQKKLQAKQKLQNQKIPTDPDGQHYGKNYLSNRHGVWTKLDVGGPDLYVWRRITRTRIDPTALSRFDMSPQRNWRHRYQITDETGAPRTRHRIVRVIAK